MPGTGWITGMAFHVFIPSMTSGIGPIESATTVICMTFIGPKETPWPDQPFFWFPFFCWRQPEFWIFLLIHINAWKICLSLK